MPKRKTRAKRKAKSGTRRQLGSRREREPAASDATEAVLAGIAHDIRTPLTGILALAELLASSDLGQREREWARAIKSGAEHLSGLATLIVDAVKADASGLTPRNEPFLPRALAEMVGQALAARAGSKHIEAKTTIAADLPAMVSGDVLRLRAALENLADNAVKFTHAGGVAFAVTAEPAARKRVKLVFAVTDSGIGMSAREQRQLFRPFAQASVEIARRYGGAGLGLTFVKRIAKAMGGDLKVTSAPGVGSTFRLSVLVERYESGALAADRVHVASSRSLALLCVEDNPYGRVVMNTILTQLGHRADFVESGEAAVAAIVRGGYDVVLMDITLPGLDGLEATRRIRALPGAAGQVPVIGLSGHNDSGSEAAARAAGMNFYFVKPVSPRQVAEVLASLPSLRSQGEGGEPR